VSDATLSSCILSVRRAIGDDVNNPIFIKTLRGQGFRFIAEVISTNLSADIVDPGGITSAADLAENGDPSISILPFTNLGNDPGLDFLADGLAEDITTELSRFRAFSVIAWSSSFQYRDATNQIEKIRTELNVDYILEGSVRQADDVFRVTAQLIHAPTAKHIWADRYDYPAGELHILQDDILPRIVASIAPEMAMQELRWAVAIPVGDLRAMEMSWQARAFMTRSRAEDAVVLDPACRHAWHTVSLANYLLAFARAGNQGEAYIARGREAAIQLRVLDRNDHRAYRSLGWINYIERKLLEALVDLRYAHDLNPNCTMTLAFMGVVETTSGVPQDGYDHICRAIRLSPRDPWLAFMIGAQAFACFALGRFEEGAECSRRAIQQEPQAPANNVILAACLVGCGEIEAAAAAITRQLQLNENFLNQIIEGNRVSYVDPVVSKRYVAALRRATKHAKGAMA
jgi:TolB-like protein